MSAATARGHGFATEVTASDDLHLRRRCLHAIRAPLQHGVEHVPALIRHSSSRASSTAASAICVPAGAGLPPGSVTRTFTCAFERTAYDFASVVTVTPSLCEAVPTLISPSP